MAQNLTIRVQALGGMFLGPDSYNGAVITVWDSAKSIIHRGFTDNGDSGQRTTNPDQPGVTPFPIKTGDVTHYVYPDANTVLYTAYLDMPRNEKLTIEARVPLPPAQGDKTVSVPYDYDAKSPPPEPPGLVLAVPGLWVQPELAVAGHTVNLKTKVTMMCGCEINHNTAKKESPWLPADFRVTAVIRLNDGGHEVASTDLAFLLNSQFTGQLELPAGDYTAEITAHQLSNSQNCGSAKATFTIS